MLSQPFPRSIADQILGYARRDEKAAVVVFRGGRPSRAFGPQEYLRQLEVPRGNRTGKGRRSADRRPDPMVAVEGRVLGPLRREETYE
ncbi:MAG: hypothetical protein L0323_24010 [Planctomycetes bacterium]|nr:hypothetical protein [Planctomycetota bacterium]